jgi:hypothetical protein
MFMPLGVIWHLKFSFLNFVQQGGTETRFENPSRYKHKRYAQGRADKVVQSVNEQSYELFD